MNILDKKKAEFLVVDLSCFLETEQGANLNEVA